MARFFGKSTIYDHANDGTPYATRYWIGRLRLHIFYRGDLDVDCHDHPWDFWTFPLTSYVEEVLDPRIADAARTFSSIRGAFICPPSKKNKSDQLVRAFRFHFRKAEHTHRLIGRWAGFSQTRTGGVYEGFAPGREHTPISCAGKIITLVWRGKSERRWGFVQNVDNLWHYRLFEKKKD